MKVHLVPCLKDNYAYLVHAEGSARAVVVDASEAGPVLEALERLGLSAVGVLATHHHLDHVGGNEGVLARFPEARVFGHESDRGRIPRQSEFLGAGARFEVGGIEFEALHIPGHTRGAVAYVAEGAAFTGDTLFAAGCGRLFEGTAAQMYESLNVTLGGLPDETRVYCGHEYTVNNLNFAASLEPANADIARKLSWARERRERGEPTLPSTLAEERATNPFLRVQQVEHAAQVSARLGAERTLGAVFGAVRALKDAF